MGSSYHRLQFLVNLLPLYKINRKHYLSVQAKSDRVARIVVVEFDYVFMLVWKLAALPSRTVAAERLDWADYTVAHSLSSP